MAWEQGSELRGFLLPGQLWEGPTVCLPAPWLWGFLRGSVAPHCFCGPNESMPATHAVFLFIIIILIVFFCLL